MASWCCARDCEWLLSDRRLRQTETTFPVMRGITEGALFALLENSMVTSNGAVQLPPDSSPTWWASPTAPSRISRAAPPRSSACLRFPQLDLAAGRPPVTGHVGIRRIGPLPLRWT